MEPVRDVSADTVPLPCANCGRVVVMPRGRVVSTTRRRQQCVVFCCPRCNMTYVAREGVKAQEKLFNGS